MLMAAVPGLFAGTGCYEVSRRRNVGCEGRGDGASRSPARDPRRSHRRSAPSATSLDGRVLRDDSGELLLAVTQIDRSVGPEEFLRNESIAVSTHSAESITVRRLDRPRTLLAAGALFAGVFLAHVATEQAAVVSLKGGPSSGTK
jgi:hypothetical protein